ncbi:MAG: hypothetical protein ACXIT4_11225 [Erythrobacter sp.]
MIVIKDADFSPEALMGSMEMPGANGMRRSKDANNFSAYIMTFLKKLGERS